MSGSRLNPAERQLAEQHLGDRLAALVDGELGHDTRDRVLAHLATCAKCKSEAEAQRRLKSVFAEAAPPPPSESFLARLQGLSDPGSPGGPGGDKPDPFGRPRADGVFGMGDDGFGIGAGTFSYAPSGGRGGLLPGGGFRIHEVGRGGAERAAAASRSRRFAFAAAGAVSLAAIALGGVSTGMPAGAAADRAEARGANASPLRTQGSGTATAAETNRRRGGAQSAGAQAAGRLPAPVAATAVSAPGLQRQLPLASPIMNRSAALPPLIRPVAATVPYSPLLPAAKSSAVQGSATAGPSGAPSPSPSAGLSLPAR
ncbi:anti-sigma factor family protein [Streptomyces sp. NPDC050418]|uniref:anti-sigma factor family protein n=1 Tax=Streptomyces sp. NPDC050418 TaxID=3365612 RepID=UPI0037A24B76